MGEKLSIYAGEPMALALIGHDENRSGRVNQVCDRYLQIVAQDAPRHWTQAQWCAACDALNGVWLRDESGIRYAWAEIADADGLAEKWGVDADALAQEMRGMTHGQRTAVVEIVQRFWNLSPDHPKPADALKAAGATFSQ